jgi:hypothetical protein
LAEDGVTFDPIDMDGGKIPEMENEEDDDLAEIASI